LFHLHFLLQLLGNYLFYDFTMKLQDKLQPKKMETVVLCGGLTYVEIDEVGLAPVVFDAMGLRAYQPLLLELPRTPSGASSSSTTNGLRFVMSAVPASGGLSATEVRVHSDLLRCVVERFGSAEAGVSANLTHSGT
jgi:hypothetical protein